MKIQTTFTKDKPVQTAPRTRRFYSDVLKQVAVDMVLKQRMTPVQVSKKLDVPTLNLNRWVRAAFGDAPVTKHVVLSTPSQSTALEELSAKTVVCNADELAQLKLNTKVLLQLNELLSPYFK